MSAQRLESLAELDAVEAVVSHVGGNRAAEGVRLLGGGGGCGLGAGEQGLGGGARGGDQGAKLCGANSHARF